MDNFQDYGETRKLRTSRRETIIITGTDLQNTTCNMQITCSDKVTWEGYRGLPLGLSVSQHKRDCLMSEISSVIIYAMIYKIYVFF